MEKEWRTVRDCPNYVVSNYGEVYSSRRNRLLKVNMNKGYHKVSLDYGDGPPRSVSIHRLVAFEFVDGYFDGAFVNHIDGVKHNNVAWNLEWVTHQENITHAMQVGLIRPMRKWVLEDDGTQRRIR